MARWFRYYTEALNDPKVQSLPPDLFKHWVNLLCIASEHDGYLPAECNVSFLLRVTGSDVTSIITALQRHGLIDVSGNQHAQTLKMHGWDKRQYKSDTSNERVKRYRKRKCNVTVTPPDTDTDTELLEPKGSKSPPSKKQIEKNGYSERFEDFWKPYPRSPTMSKAEAWKAWKKLSEEDRDMACRAVHAFVAYCKSNPDYPPVHACRFLSQRRFDGFTEASRQLNGELSERQREADEKLAKMLGVPVESLR